MPQPRIAPLTKPHLIMLAAAGMGAVAPATQAKAMTDREQLRILLGQVKRLRARMDEKDRDEQKRRQEAAAAPPEPKIAKAAATPGFDKFSYKGIEIIPGGFLALESVWRSAWLGADVATPYNAIPYGFATTGRTDEFHFSARASRPALLVRGDLDPATHIQGYFESDFLGAGQTANSNQSNSYNFRVRQLYANVDRDDLGLHVMAGQAWSLATMNSVGIRPDTSLQPPTIDHNYMPGYVWGRTPGVRVTKDFGKEFWFAFAAEGAATTFAVPGPVLANSPFGPMSVALPNNLGIVAPALLAPAGQGGTFDVNDTYAFNRLPDLTAKAAWDAPVADRVVHLEAFGLAREMTDRVYFGNHRTWDGGFGAGAVVPVIPKLLDFQISGMMGRGVGRYGASQIADATYTLTGALQPIHQRSILIGATLHPTPQTDVFAFAGGDFASKNPQFASIGGTLYAGGYGNPLYNNIGCRLENPVSQLSPGVASAVALSALGNPLLGCSGQTKDLRQITGGVWHNLYQGHAGKIRLGLQFSHTIRNGFVGLGGAPRGTENTVLTSLRYFPF
ncbi:hypothetical protein [Methylocystis parvus]|uniref:hypothetical protein n=1 Tax=Methylocystis parvus TaxID=134 RepID=UPI003C75902A